MRYPVLTESRCRELAEQLVSGTRPAIDASVQWAVVGDDLDLDVAPIARAAQQITEGAFEWTDPDKDRYEGKAAVVLYEILSPLPPEIIDDRGFWAYLAIRHFWDFIAWREELPFAKGNYLKYVDAKAPTESVLTRMFMRAQALHDANGVALAGAIPKATDFWRSHIIRVRTGTAPHVATAFARRQLDSRLRSTPLRMSARRLNRLWSNLVPYVYGDEEAEAVIGGVWTQSTSES